MPSGTKVGYKHFDMIGVLVHVKDMGNGIYPEYDKDLTNMDDVVSVVLVGESSTTSSGYSNDVEDWVAYI